MTVKFLKIKKNLRAIQRIVTVKSVKVKIVKNKLKRSFEMYKIKRNNVNSQNVSFFSIKHN